MEDVFMGSSPLLALLLPMSVVIGVVVYATTGKLLYGLIAFALDAVPASIIYMTQLRVKRQRTSVAQDRLSRYSSNDR
jgi:hypothetical protein